jgi:hypothetical protein
MIDGLRGEESRTGTGTDARDHASDHGPERNTNTYADLTDYADFADLKEARRPKKCKGTLGKAI